MPKNFSRPQIPSVTENDWRGAPGVLRTQCADRPNSNDWTHAFKLFKKG